MKKCWFVAGRRRKGKGERRKRKGRERERESRWCWGLDVDKSLMRVPQRCMYLQYCHATHFLEIENNLKLFSISVTQSHFFENWVTKIGLGNSSKQSNLLWGPQNSEIKWWKLSIGWWKHLNQTTPKSLTFSLLCCCWSLSLLMPLNPSL